MSPAQRITLASIIAAALVAVITVALTIAQWVYWNDPGAAFATFIGGAFIAAFLKPD